MTNNRGGARPGAGRPSDPNRRVMFSPRIKPEALAKLKKLAKKNSASVPEILEALIERSPDVIEVKP